MEEKKVEKKGEKTAEKQNDKAAQVSETEKLQYDCALVTSKLRRWEKFMKNYDLPTWEELPDFGLYMDQVVALLSRYLDFNLDADSSEKMITVSTVNNYVRLKIMPAPEKKKYSRIHLAYLLMICTLKQNLSIAYVQKMIPMGLSEDEVRERYNAFVKRHRGTAMYFIEQVRQACTAVLAPTGQSADVEDLIASAAVFGSLSRILTEKLIDLQGKTLE